MKKLLFSCAAILAFSGAAMAADVSEPVASTYDWTGPYVGVHAGYLWGDVDVTYEDLGGGGEIDGFIGGGLAGYNYQSDNLVFGVEGDFGLTGADGNGLVCMDACTEIYSYDMNWNAHLRGRVGLAMDRTLLFVAGGLAIAEHELGATYGNQMTGSGTETHYGFTIGGGAEYAMTDNLLLRIEYLYDDYGDKRYNFGEDPGDHYDADILRTRSVRQCRSF
jgi:outer membrane immunogenic protein